MGQKVNPIGLRLGINKTWQSRWYADPREYADLLHEDLRIRKMVLALPECNNADIAEVEIVRHPQRVTIVIHTARPGVIIGVKGANIEKIGAEIQKKLAKKVQIKIKEIKRAEVNVTLENYDAALEDYSTALLENEDDTALYLGRANIYFEKGDYEAAISDYDYYLNEWKDAVAFGNRGYCHFVLENLDAALEDLDSCIELKNDYAWAYHTRGQILQAQEKFEEAKEDYEKANSLMESNE